MEYNEFKEYLEANGYFEAVDEETVVSASPIFGFENTQSRRTKSKLGDISVGVKRLAESVDKGMDSPLLSNSRVTISPVLDNKLATQILLDNGFEEADLVSAVFASVPSDLDVMPIAQWVINKYTTNSSVLEEIKVYDKVSRKSNIIGFAVNNMEHDRGSKLVFGGKIASQTYVAPYMLLKYLNENNTLDKQLFNGYLLGLSELDKGALKSNPESHYSRALRQNAYDKVLEYEYYGIQLFSEENGNNAWAFRVLDNYKQANKQFWTNELELDLMELQEALIEAMGTVDWRFSADKIARAVILKTDSYLSSFIDFYNGEAVIEAINELEYDKSKFKQVQAELVKLANGYLRMESEEDNLFSVEEMVEDYDFKKTTDHSQSRGYKKAYVEQAVREMAIARGVITEIIHREHYSRSMECYLMESELEDIRKSSVAHEKEQEARFKENKEEQAFWDRMEAELGVTGLTAFTPASNSHSGEAEWASRSEEHFAYFLDRIRAKLA